jgi:predicted ATP-grasp superfamily ATP-dependent carboligase/protein-tyrosine-phosphatase
MLIPAQRGVLVTDGNERAALAVTRSLGRRGIPVYVGAETSRSLAGTSRYCRGSFVYPSPWQAPDEYVGCLIEQARMHDASVVFPVTDLAVELLGEAQLRGCTTFILPIPSLERYHSLSNKYRLMQWAQKEGIPIPETHFVTDGDVDAIIPGLDRWPVVVKPGRSLVRVHGSRRKTSVQYARDADELRRLYAEHEELREPSLVQSRIVGQGEGVFGIFEKGNPRAMFAHRRIREKPPSGGVSVLRESIALPEPMTTYAETIARSVEWHGVAMMEFKVDRQSGIPYLMEVNGRFWGSLQLAIDAGVDFPWLLYQLATTGSVPESHPYRIGVKSRWWLGDVDHLLLRLRKSEKELSLPPGSPSRLATITNFLNVFDEQTQGEVFRLTDLRPGLHEMRMYLQPLFDRIGPALARRLSAAGYAMARTAWTVGLKLGLHRRRIKRIPSGGGAAVLVLCKGNICRSPFAAGYLMARSKSGRGLLEIMSAGLDTTAGKPAYPLAITTSVKHGVDLRHHRTTVLSKELVDKADIILAMELVHNTMLFRQFPEARKKTFLLGHFAPDPLTDIRDPYGGSSEEFEECYALIVKACDGLLQYVQSSPHLAEAGENAFLRIQS